MPRTRSNATASNSVDTHKSNDPEDHVDLDTDNDNEDVVEEEVEYEEVEEEVEVEEDDEEEEEEEVEEEVEEEEDDDNVLNGDHANNLEDENMKDAEADVELEKKHAELLALPPHGSEVYVGGFPQDISEEDLRQFCESAGEVTEVRIMKGKGTTENKGYAFVTYRTKEMASEAIKSLNGTEWKGKRLKCSTSQEKHRLFIGNIPRTWEEEDLKNVVNKIGPGVINVQLVKDPQNSSRNRGFAFIEYYNHACADYSREKMSIPKFKLDENDPTVSWADPPKNLDSSSSSQIKAVYVKNLPKDITQDQLRELFEHHGKIIKVILPPAKAGHENSRFGFVHFAEKSSAMKAIKNTEKYEIDGQLLECSLAKPQVDQKSSGGANMQKPTMLPTYPSAGGYGFVGGYNALGAGLAQPMMYGRGAAPAGLAMIPMVLPDGRIGYVLQQPGIHAAPITAPSYRTPTSQRVGGRSGSGGGSGGGRGGGSSEGRRSSSSSSSNDRGRGGRNSSRYNPY